MSYSLDVVEDSVLPDGRAVSDGWCVIGAAFGQAAWLSSGGRSEANGETTGTPVQKTNEGTVRQEIFRQKEKKLRSQPAAGWKAFQKQVENNYTAPMP